MSHRYNTSNSRMAKKKISIIGSGWVGTAIGKGFTGIGYEVIFYDVIDKYLPKFTKNINYAIENSDISFISVPTPTTTNGNDLSYVKEASKNIGKALSNKIPESWNKDKGYKKDFFTEDWIVIGEHNKKSGEILEGVL